MTAVEKLIAYIKSLSPEQTKKVIDHLPEIEAVLNGDEPVGEGVY